MRGKVSHFDPLLFSKQDLVAVKEQNKLVLVNGVFLIMKILLFDKSRNFNNNIFIIIIHLY